MYHRFILLVHFSYKINICFILGYIDLSKRRVSPEEVVKCEEKFAKAKAVSTWSLMYSFIRNYVKNDKFKQYDKLINLE